MYIILPLFIHSSNFWAGVHQSAPFFAQSVIRYLQQMFQTFCLIGPIGSCPPNDECASFIWMTGRQAGHPDTDGHQMYIEYKKAFDDDVDDIKCCLSVSGKE